jgi:hypothetical protein
MIETGTTRSTTTSNMVEFIKEWSESTASTERTESSSSIDPTEQDDSVSSDEASASDNGSTTTPRTSAIRFGAVLVREFERIPGDHPDTRVGVPLGIGWGFHERDAVPLDQFESEFRKSGEAMKHIPRVPSVVRRRILHDEFGISDDQLLQSEKAVLKSRKQRAYSNKQSKMSARAESALVSLRRKLYDGLRA